MGDLKLFSIAGGVARELAGSQAPLEKPLQTLIEENLETMFGVRLLASEYVTSQRHGGRMDSLGIDENGSPVIFEYKRTSNENVINQGLFYLDWLLDHQADFELLVQRRLGSSVAGIVDWSNPRLVCVAGDFNRYDEHAVAQINRSIELVRYRYYEGGLFALELVTTASPQAATPAPNAARLHRNAEPLPASTKSTSPAKTISDYHAQAPQDLQDLYDALEQYVLALGDDVTKKVTQQYYAFRRIKNFACVEIHPRTKTLLIFVNVDPDLVSLEPGFTRDVRKIGHYGTGDLEIRVTDREQLSRAEGLLQVSYEGS